MTQRLRKDMDVTVDHLAAGKDHITPKARGFQEINRRRLLPAGVLIREQERTGLSVMGDTLSNITDVASRNFAAQTFALTLFNGSWYNSAQHAQHAAIENAVGRRRVKLPDLTGAGEAGEEGWRPDSEALVGVSCDRLQLAVDIAGRLLVSPETKGFKSRQKAYGRYLGDTALVLASVEIGDYTVTAPAVEAQHLAWQRGLEVVRDSRSLGEEIGSHPSPAQFANPDSDLSIYWRRNAPQDAFEALQQAVTAAGLAA